MSKQNEPKKKLKHRPVSNRDETVERALLEERSQPFDEAVQTEEQRQRKEKAPASVGVESGPESLPTDGS